MRKPWIFNDQTNIYPACLLNAEMSFYGGHFLTAGFGQTFPENHTKPLDNKTVVLPSSSSKEKLLMTWLKLYDVDLYLLGLNNPKSSVCYGTNERRSFGIY